MPPSLFAAWSARTPAVTSLFHGDCREPSDRIASTKRAATRSVSPALLAELRRQDARLPASAARAANLAKLEAGGAAVVITGQQVGLFLGPLYTFFKAASAIRVAAELEKESGVPTVPLFWLQTEDHDFPEVCYCELPARDGEKPLRLSLHDAADASANASNDALSRTPLHERKLGPSLAECLEALGSELQPLPHGDEVLALFRRHYVEGKTLPDAFAGVLAELFSEEGLLILDPRAEAVASAWAPALSTALEKEPAISLAIEARGEALRGLGYEPQVHVRPQSPLFFFHPEGPGGPRYRLDRDGDGFSLAGDPQGRKVDAATVRRLLRDEPLRFSTSALLRPLLQDSLFPTAAYVGGPGELAYTAQLSPLYPVFGVAPPLFVPRNGFRLVDPLTRRALDALGVSSFEVAVAKSEDALFEKLGGGHGLPQAEAFEAELSGAVLKALAAAELVAKPLGSDLEDAARRTEGTLRRAVSRYAARYGRARLSRDETLLRRIRRVRVFLAPEGEPQERRLALPTFAAVFGPAHLKARVLEAVTPFDPTLKELSP